MLYLFLNRLKSLPLVALALAALLTCGAACARAPVDPWPTVVRGVVARAEFQALPLSVEVSAKAQQGSPLSMEWREGRCVLLVRTHRNPQAQALLELAAPSARTLFMQAVAVHELAHCYRTQDKPELLAALFSLAERAERQSDLTPQLEQDIRREETFADVAALAWAEREDEARYPDVLSAFERLREDPRFTGPRHDTRLALARIRRFGMLYGETAFDAADTTLAALRPARTWSTRRSGR